MKNINFWYCVAKAFIMYGIYLHCQFGKIIINFKLCYLWIIRFVYAV